MIPSRLTWYPLGGTDNMPLGDVTQRLHLTRDQGVDHGVRRQEIRNLYEMKTRYTRRPRFAAPGDFPSPKYVGSKEPQIRFRLIAPPGEDFYVTQDRVRALLQPDVAGLGWLSWRERGNPDAEEADRFLFCSVVDRNAPQTVLSTSGQYADYAVRFRAEDPNIYSHAVLQHNLIVTAAGSGLDFDEGHRTRLRGLDFGAVSETDLRGLDFPDDTPASTLVENKGNREAFVRFSVTAGSEELRVIELINLTTGDAAIFAAQDVVPGEDVTDANGYMPIVQPGQTMEVDLNPNTRSVLVDGVNAFGLWRRPQIPLTVEPGGNNFKYIPDTPDGGVLVLRFRHTWL